MTLFNLGKYHIRASHLFADLIEILLMVGFEERDSIYIPNVRSVFEHGDISPEELDEERQEFDDEVDEAVKQDTASSYYDDCLNLLEYRVGAYGEFYPFYLDDKTLYIKKEISEAQKVYFFLLACSRLRSFPSELRLKWADFFTELSKLALQSLLPASGYVRIFDANSYDRREYFDTDLRKALKMLGSRIGVSNVDEEACDEESSSGDRGLDLVGVVDYDEDSATGYHVFFGQCAAREKEWPKKRFESSPLGFSTFYSFSSYPTNSVFIPICYRRANGNWVKRADGAGSLLHDRLRIMTLLKNHAEYNWSSLVELEWFDDFMNKLSEIQESLKLA